MNISDKVLRSIMGRIKLYGSLFQSTEVLASIRQEPTLLPKDVTDDIKQEMFYKVMQPLIDRKFIAPLDRPSWFMFTPAGKDFMKNDLELVASV